MTSTNHSRKQKNFNGQNSAYFALLVSGNQIRRPIIPVRTTRQESHNGGELEEGLARRFAGFI